MNSSFPRARRAAFTLIELLTVIAIIAILASMLLPSLSRAREMARRTSCMSNMRQLNLGVQQYMQDYDERLPLAAVGTPGENKIGGWVYYSRAGNGTDDPIFDVSRGGIYSYIKSRQVYVCPNDTIGQSSGVSYAINSCALISGSDVSSGLVGSKSEAAFDETTKWMLFSEEKFYREQTTDDGFQLIGINPFSDRHTDGSLISFMDGHTKWYRRDKILTDNYQTGGVPPTTAGSCP